MTFGRDVVVIGGCGHVGLPLAIGFADRGLKTIVYDINEAAVSTVNAARLIGAHPFAALRH